MDDQDRAETDRKRLLATPCGFCGQGAGWWCVDAGGREIRNANRQHKIRYSLARIDRFELRVLLVRAGLV